MEVIDKAQENEQLFTELALKNAKQQTLTANGRCHYCEETIDEGLRFCDVDCRDDYDREQRILRRRNGG